MRLLTSTDVALRVLMRLSAEPDEHISTDVLARELAVSRNHLHKIVQYLTHVGLVRTIRGARGGVMLARPAAKSGSARSCAAMNRIRLWWSVSAPTVELARCCLAAVCAPCWRPRKTPSTSIWTNTLWRTASLDPAHLRANVQMRSDLAARRHSRDRGLDRDRGA